MRDYNVVSLSTDEARLCLKEKFIFFNNVKLDMERAMLYFDIMALFAQLTVIPKWSSMIFHDKVFSEEKHLAMFMRYHEDFWRLKTYDHTYPIWIKYRRYHKARTFELIDIMAACTLFNIGLLSFLKSVKNSEFNN